MRPKKERSDVLSFPKRKADMDDMYILFSFLLDFVRLLTILE